MQEFDSDTSEGSRLLLAGPTPPDTAQVDEVRTVGDASSRRGCRACGPRSPRQDQADESLALLNRVLGETDALAGTACDPAAAVTDACRDGGADGGRLRFVRVVVGPELTAPAVPTPERGDHARRRRVAADGTRGRRRHRRRTTTPVRCLVRRRSDDDGDSTTGTATARAGSAGTDDRRRDGGGGGGSGGSGGSGDVSVPLPLPAKVGRRRRSAGLKPA